MAKKIIKHKKRGFVTQLASDDYSICDIKCLRIERMDNNHIWMCAYPADGGERVDFKITAEGIVDMQILCPMNTNFAVARMD